MEARKGSQPFHALFQTLFLMFSAIPRRFSIVNPRPLSVLSLRSTTIAAHSFCCTLQSKQSLKTYYALGISQRKIAQLLGQSRNSVAFVNLDFSKLLNVEHNHHNAKISFKIVRQIILLAVARRLAAQTIVSRLNLKLPVHYVQQINTKSKNFNNNTFIGPTLTSSLKNKLRLFTLHPDYEKGLKVFNVYGNKN